MLGCIEAQAPQMSWHKLAYLTLYAGDNLHVTSYTQDLAASSRVFCASECFREGVSICCAAMPFWPRSVIPYLMNFYAFLLNGEKWSRALEISKSCQLFERINFFISFKAFKWVNWTRKCHENPLSYFIIDCMHIV